MAHDLFRAARVMAVAVLTLLATACGTPDSFENPPKTALVDVTTGTEAQRLEARLAAVQMRVAREALQQGSLGAALDLFEKAHKNAPRTTAPLIGKGDVLFAQRRFPAAEAAYRAALQRDPASYEANEGLGKTLVTLKKFRDGLRAFEAARAVRADAGLINKIGVTHELMGDGATAQAHFREALALDEKSLTARNNLALSLAVSGSYDEALSEMEKVVAAPGSSERHHANLAFVYGLAGRSLNGAPPKVSQAAANKGWDEAFFARTRNAAESGDRAAVLDLLHNRAPRTAALPAATQLPEMPEMPASEAEADAAPQTAATATPVPLARPATPDPVANTAPSPADTENSPVPTDAPTEASAAAPKLPETPVSTEIPAAKADDGTAAAAPTPQPMPELAAIPAPAPGDAEKLPIPADRPVETPAENRAATEPAPLSAPVATPAPAGTREETAAPETRIALQTPKSMPAAAAPPEGERTAPESGYRVQLGAHATPWLGRALRMLGDRAGGLLPENRVEVVRGRDFHTLRSARIGERDAARRICNTLRSRNVECFVTRQTRSSPAQGFDITGAGDAGALAAFLATVEPIPAPMEATATTPKTAVAALQPAPAAPAPAAEAGAYRIQFAAYRRAAHLARGLDVLRRMAGDALPEIVSLVRAESPATTAIPYRLRSAPMESRDAAAGLCRSLSEKGVECLVIRHGEKAWRPLS